MEQLEKLDKPIECDHATEEGLLIMSVDRSKMRAKQKEKRIATAIERRLDSRNLFGISDPTPKAAIDNIIMEVSSQCEAN